MVKDAKESGKTAKESDGSMDRESDSCHLEATAMEICRKTSH